MADGRKVVLLGDSNVGKTSILQRYILDTFEERGPATIGASFISKRVEFSKTHQAVVLNIWDTAGQERYHSLAKHYFQGAKVAIVVFDITKRDSFEGAKHWITDIKANEATNALIFIVANKIDLVDQEQVPIDEVQQYSTKEGVRCFMASAKENVGIAKLFMSVAKHVATDDSGPRPKKRKGKAKDKDEDEVSLLVRVGLGN